MIQLTKYAVSSPDKIQDTIRPYNSFQSATENKDKECMGKRNIYLDNMEFQSPTYNDDIEQLMKNADIPLSNENAQIVKLMNQYGIEVEKSKVEEIKQAKDAFDTVIHQLHKEHLVKLQQQGYNIEELTIDTIAKAIANGGEMLARQEEYKGSLMVDSDVIHALVQSNLPLTEKNIEILMKYKQKVENIISSDDVAVKNMLRGELEVTVNNLYMAKHSGEGKSNELEISEEQLIKVLQANGIEVTRESLRIAQKLIQGNIAITKQTVQKFTHIKNTLQRINIPEFMMEATKAIKNGQNPGDVIIENEKVQPSTNETYDDIKQMIEDIKHFDEHIIEYTYKKHNAITIGNLQQSLYENTQKIVESKKESQYPKEVISAKRQIEEIRLQLTVEATQKLSPKLDIKTSDLKKVVQELKVLEQEQYKEVLENTHAPITQENIDCMEKIQSHIKHISENREVAAVQVVRKQVPFTLEGMDEAVQTQKAHQMYEQMGTKPEPHLGDRIRNVEDQIEYILHQQDIRVTDLHIRAAKALVYNNIDITKQNVEDTKNVMLKIDTVLYELPPVVVAQMLRDGIRPDITHIDQLIQYAHEYRTDNNYDTTKHLAEAILELDHAGELQPEERDALIGVYRMFRFITKNEEKAIGFLVKNEKELTVGNLFEASKYIQKLGSDIGKMDVMIDDQFGVRHGELPENIRSLIEKGTHQPVEITSSFTEENISELINNQHILNRWLAHITPEQLKKYINSNEWLEDIDTKDEYLSTIETKTLEQQVDTLQKLSSQTLSSLKEHSIPLTLPNIHWLDKTIKNPFLLGDMLNEYEKLTGEKLITTVQARNKQNVEEILDDLQKELEKQKPIQLSASQNTMAYTIGKDLEQLINMQKQMANSEGIYQIPIQLHHGASNLNIYVPKDKEHTQKVESNELRAYMSIKTKNLGVIQVHMRIVDHALSFQMIGENLEITDRLQHDSSELKKAIEDIGYKVINAQFSQGEAKNLITPKDSNSISILKHKFKESVFEHIV